MTPNTHIAPTVDAANPWATHAVRIRAIRREIPQAFTYELGFEDPEVGTRFRFRPGQFDMLYLPGIGEAAISISSDPDNPNRLAHTIRAVGNVTRALSRKHVGDQILLRGPFGSSWPVESCEGQDLVIAAGGLGLAPVRPVLYHVINRRERYGKVWLLYGARSPRDLLYTAEYNDWRQADIDVQITVDLGYDGWDGHIGVVPTLFDRLRPDPKRTRVITCGPEIMMQFVISACLTHGISARNIYLSMERNMNCALGFCGHCQLGPAFVCKDGPVFTYAQMEPYLDVEDF
ncbi:MAG: FAD/NAD(P)-binding protein [Planctomycetales bacterium]|nr:FAD/NAD(P)-binding protein [Planctomycetales bacterium]